MTTRNVETTMNDLSVPSIHSMLLLGWCAEPSSTGVTARYAKRAQGTRQSGAASKKAKAAKKKKAKAAAAAAALEPVELPEGFVESTHSIIPVAETASRQDVHAC